MPPPLVATQHRIIVLSCSKTAFSAMTSPASPSSAKISSRVEDVTCSMSAGVERGVYPRVLASAFATATLACSLSPTNVTLTPFISSATASHAALSAFASAAALSAAARATDAERRRLRDARARRAGATAGADERPTAEMRDMGGAAAEEARVCLCRGSDMDIHNQRKEYFLAPSRRNSCILLLYPLYGHSVFVLGFWTIIFNQELAGFASTHVRIGDVRPQPAVRARARPPR